MKFLADENFNNRFVRGLQRRLQSIDLARVQELTIASQDDPSVLAWAAEEGRILLTHDQRTMPYYALARLRRGDVLADLIIVGDELPIGDVIDGLFIIATCTYPEEWVDRIEYLPL